jgi:hypothetical protein
VLNMYFLYFVFCFMRLDNRLKNFAHMLVVMMFNNIYCYSVEIVNNIEFINE